jgi:type IV pilus assembly protein PilX
MQHQGTLVNPPRPPSRQRGISLIVSLILLLLVTLVALASVRTVVLQSRMSATSHDRNLAFQAAESALRAAETAATASDGSAVPAAGCSAGICALPGNGEAARWLSGTFDGWLTTTEAVSDNAATPETIVESMGEGSNWTGCQQRIPREPNCVTARYRVTARSAAADRAGVIVQSEVAAAQ